MDVISAVMKGLNLDKWYKALFFLGAGLFLVSIFVDIRGMSNTLLVFISLGMFFIGFGEWLNAGKVVAIIPPNVYLGGQAIKVEQPAWRPRPLGLLLDLVGIFMLFIGIYIFLNPEFHKTVTILLNPK
jgi:uncharacterized membrane protein